MAMYTEAESKGRIGREPTGQKEYFRFLLRMPPEMARKIDAWAKEEFCPMNSYLLRVIRDHIWDVEADQAAAEAEAIDATEQKPRAVRRGR